MLRYVVATLVSLALVTAVSWGADPARPAKLISVTVTGKAELAVVRLGEAIPLVVTIANDLPGPVIFTTFSLKPNDWNGESFSLTLVDITRDGKPGGLFLERPKVDPPVRISGTSGHTIKAGETLSVSSDARKWAIAGGWAIDLHLGEVTRPHDDLEIVLSRDDFHVLQACLGGLDWFAVGNGRAWPLADAPPELHQTWGRDADGRWRLDVFREPWENAEWVYRRDPRIRRPLADAIERDPAGIPYLAPELVLLFKAKAAGDKEEADLASALPSLTPARISWLREALRIVHPGHDWLPRLTAS